MIIMIIIIIIIYDYYPEPDVRTKGLGWFCNQHQVHCVDISPMVGQASLAGIRENHVNSSRAKISRRSLWAIQIL